MYLFNFRTAARVTSPILLCLIFLIPTISAFGQQARFQGLGVLTAEGVSDDGKVVVLRKNPAQAFIWMEDTGAIGLPGPLIDSPASQGFGISGNGQVIVGSAKFEGSFNRPMRWTTETGIVSLGWLHPEAFAAGDANDASEDGSVIVGWAVVEDDNYATEGFIWTPETGMRALGDLPGGLHRGRAEAVSGDGSVVVGWAGGPNGNEAVRWVDGGVPQILEGLSTGANSHSQAAGVSQDGSYIVGRLNTEGADQGFLWHEDTGVVGLDIPEGFRWTSATDVSADGSVVVGAMAPLEPGPSQAGIWTASTGWRTIQDALENDHGVNMNGWRLTQANGISADGTVIVGFGNSPENGGEGWRADLGCVVGVGKRSSAACECAAPVYTWVLDQGISFDLGNNWNPEEEPPEDALIHFESEGYAPVNFNKDTTTEGLRIFQKGRVEFRMDDHNYVLKAESHCGPDLIIRGDTEPAHLEIKNGLLRSKREAVISDGELSVDESGSFIAKQLRIAETGSGTVSIPHAVGFRVDSLLQMALTTSATADFNMNVTESEPLLLLPLRTEIGTRGTATFLVEGKAKITGPALLDPPNQSAEIILGVESGSQGTMELKGEDIALFSPEIDPDRFTTITVGAAGTGTMKLSDGAVMRPDSVVVGHTGTGSVTVSGGGIFIDQRLVMAAENDAEATFTIEGDSGEEPPTLFILGEAEIGRKGEATLSVKDNAVVSGTFFTPGEPGTVVFGKFNNAEGSLEVNGADARFLVDEQQRMDVIVGESGKGDMQILAGGQVAANTLWIGKEESGFGSAFVGGGGSQLTTEKLAIGTGAFGVLHVENNGLVSTQLLWVGEHGQVQGNVLAVGTYNPPSKRAEATIVTGMLLVAADAQIEVESLELAEDAVLGGTATWTQPITNTGGISPGDPGNPTGIFRAGAGYVQTSEGTLHIDLGSGTSDQLEVTGTATLDGKLAVAVVSGSTPMIGDEFVILTAGEVTGVFAQIEPQAGLEIEVAYTATEATIRVLEYDATAVAVEEVIESAQASTFQLHQNYPNPFNPQTVIGYEVAEPGHVILAVYDLLGREVNRLIDGPKAQGRYNAVFDAGELPSGVYVYRLSVGTRRVVSQQSRRMVLLR